MVQFATMYQVKIKNSKIFRTICGDHLHGEYIRNAKSNPAGNFKKHPPPLLVSWISSNWKIRHYISLLITSNWFRNPLKVSQFLNNQDDSHVWLSAYLLRRRILHSFLSRIGEIKNNWLKLNDDDEEAKVERAIFLDFFETWGLSRGVSMPVPANPSSTRSAIQHSAVQIIQCA